MIAWVRRGYLVALKGSSAPLPLRPTRRRSPFGPEKKPMSNCDLEIEFEPSSRIFRGGDPVRGTVIAHVTEDVHCRALRFEAFWETHGRGNVDHGNVDQTILFEGQWNQGESYRYPFTFVAPAFPPTLRGKSLNVDHYVQVSADLDQGPGAMVREDYLLLASGDRSAAHPAATRRKPGASTDSLGGHSSKPLLFFVVLGIIGANLPMPFGALLILMSVVLGVRKARHISAVRKLGAVQASVEPTDLLTGGAVAVDLTLAPKRDIQIKRITVSLRGTEVSVSGSGTDETTHRRVLSDTTEVIAEEVKVEAKRQLELQHIVRIPADAAPSFVSANNEMIWTLCVKIEQPRFPTWKREWVLRVLPQPWEEGLVPHDPAEMSPPAQVPPLPPPPSREPAVPPTEPEPDQPEEAVPPAASPPDDSEPAPPDSPASTFANTYTAIQALDRFGEERKLRIEQELGREHEFDFLLQRVKWTYGEVGEDYKQGRTLEGLILPQEHSVLIHLPKSLNGEADALEPGTKLHLTATLSTWNSTYGQPEFEAPGLGARS